MFNRLLLMNVEMPFQMHTGWCSSVRVPGRAFWSSHRRSHTLSHKLVLSLEYAVNFNSLFSIDRFAICSTVRIEPQN